MHNRPFCDGHHIFKVKSTTRLCPSKWANGRVPLLPLRLWKHLR
jgi:hypothetical protein